MNSIWGNSISPGITILANQIFTMYTSNGVNIDFTGKVVPGKKQIERHTTHFHCFGILSL